MTTPPKTMSSIRNAEAEKYASRILNTLEDADARSRSFKAGWDARDKLGDEALGKAVEALEFIGKMNEPTSEMGLSVAFLEMRGVCRRSLAEIRKIMGDE